MMWKTELYDEFMAAAKRSMESGERECLGTYMGNPMYIVVEKEADPRDKELSDLRERLLELERNFYGIRVCKDRKLHF